MTESGAVPGSVDSVLELLEGQSYIADRALATAIHLSLTLGRPLLLEGEAGVGKTEVGKVLSQGRNNVLVVDFAWFLFLTPQERYAEALKLLYELEQQDPLSPLTKQGIGFQL